MNTIPKLETITISLHFGKPSAALRSSRPSTWCGNSRTPGSVETRCAWMHWTSPNPQRYVQCSIIGRQTLKQWHISDPYIEIYQIHMYYLFCRGSKLRYQTTSDSFIVALLPTLRLQKSIATFIVSGGDIGVTSFKLSLSNFPLPAKAGLGHSGGAVYKVIELLGQTIWRPHPISCSTSDEQLYLSLSNDLRPCFYIKLIQIASNCFQISSEAKVNCCFGGLEFDLKPPTK